MPRILIANDDNAGYAIEGARRWGRVVVEVVTLSILDEIYGVRCTGDGLDECPDADDLAETWLNRENSIAWAVEHVEKHERRA
jgi:hypothetical protein